MRMTPAVTKFDLERHEGRCSFCGVDQLGYDVTVFWSDRITLRKKRLFCNCARKWLVFMLSKIAREIEEIPDLWDRMSEP